MNPLDKVRKVWRSPEKRKVIRWAVTASIPLVTTLAIYLIERFLEHRGFGGVAAIIAAAFSLLAIVTATVLYNAELLDEAAKRADEGDDAPEIKLFRDPVEFAIFRANIVMQLNPAEIVKPICCTSHCNLFARPGGGSEDINTQLRGINAVFFRSLAKCAVGGSNSGLKLLLQFESLDDDDVFDEVRERLRIWVRVCSARDDVNLRATEFEVRQLLPASLKDYFVVGDHVFKTVRKTPASGGATQFIYIRSAAIADTYRDWLTDVFGYGHHSRAGSPAFTSNASDLTNRIQEIWDEQVRAHATAKRDLEQRLD